MTSIAQDATASSLPKCATAIAGFDEITGGGLPRNRITLVSGEAGCGKTLMGMQFLLGGIVEDGEPGLFIAFEETPREIVENFRSLGTDLDQLIAERKLLIEHIRVERSEIQETGDYDLEGLFVRIGMAIDAIGAKRVVLDTIETLFSGFSNTAILRSELRRLFQWLKERKVTSIITGERGKQTLTRHGLEEYVSDCVIVLDHRAHEETSTRRLRVIKYRGSTHGTNEFPFLIDEAGITVMPLSSLDLNHSVSLERVSSGVDWLDAMLGGGYFRGSSVLVSGSTGTGKTSAAMHFATAAGQRGERCLYFAFEESPLQVARNMRSIGVDVEPLVASGHLRFHAVRPTLHGLELHLVEISRQIAAFDPQVVVFDPITSFTGGESLGNVHSMFLRAVDLLKSRGVTSVFTSLVGTDQPEQAPDIGITSLMDTWISLHCARANGYRKRAVDIIKSRGTAHSNQVREFLLTDRGFELPETVQPQTARP